MRLIVAASGIPVVAHPYSIIKHSSLNWDSVLEKLLSAGIQGLEAYNPTYTVGQTLLFLESAQRHGLLVTGGSDFHAAAVPETQIGAIPRWSPLSYEMVENLKALLRKQRNGLKIGRRRNAAGNISPRSTRRPYFRAPSS